jgi:hypothetical protein
MMSMGMDAGIPVEWDGLPAWLDHFGVDLAKTNTKWYKDPACVNIAKNQFIFIGFKNSTDCFSQVMIKCKGVDIPNTLTDNYALRNYLPNVVKSKSQKENKRGEYTLWGNVQKHNPSICGAYISYYDLWMQQQASANQTVVVSFPMTITYDNLVYFENFCEYMNFIYGDLQLNVKVSPNALVWCCVDPKYSLAHGVEMSKLEPVLADIGRSTNKVTTDISTILLDQCAKNISIKSEADVYTKRFTQVHSWGRALTNVVVSSRNPLNTTTLGNFAGLVTAAHV